MCDYYAILNLSPNATAAQIKSAFRKEALKWHPDRNKSLDAINKMQLINEAYLILKDEEARSKYDREYKRYQNFKSQQKTTRDVHSSTSSTSSNNQYKFDDDVLNDWIKKARKQARDMVRMSVDDLVGMSKSAIGSAWEATKYHILVLIVLSFVLFAIAK